MIKMTVRDELFWECQKCSRKLSITSDSIVKGTKIDLFDALLHMWIDKIPSASALKLIESNDVHKIG